MHNSSARRGATHIAADRRLTQVGRDRSIGLHGLAPYTLVSAVIAGGFWQQWPFQDAPRRTWAFTLHALASSELKDIELPGAEATFVDVCSFVEAQANVSLVALALTGILTARMIWRSGVFLRRCKFKLGTADVIVLEGGRTSLVSEAKPGLGHKTSDGLARVV